MVLISLKSCATRCEALACIFNIYKERGKCQNIHTDDGFGIFRFVFSKSLNSPRCKCILHK